jgi:DNA polymerase III sliding clamp (beta) subunit (PCNA family)
MEFTAQAAGLFRGLQLAADISNKNPVKDFLSAGRVGFRIAQNGITVYAWNGRLSFESVLTEMNTNDFSYGFVEAGEIVVAASDLSRIAPSFQSDDKLVITSGKSTDSKDEVVFALASDKEQFQTVPCFSEKIDMPKQSSDLPVSVDMRRDIFLRGVSKVFYAIGDEQERERYLYWVIRARNGQLRFASGDGRRYAFLDVSGTNLFSAKVDLNLMMPKEQTPGVVKVLNSISDENITIKTTKSGNQIVISAGDTKLILVGIKEDVEWINEDKVLAITYPIRMTAQLSDWILAARGTLATYTEEMKKERRVHKASVVIDLIKKEIIVKTEEKMKSLRKVKVLDFDGATGKIEMSMPSYCILDISNQSEGDGYVQIEYISATDNKKRPFLIRHFAAEKVADGNSLSQTNKALGITEKFIMVVAQLA